MVATFLLILFEPGHFRLLFIIKYMIVFLNELLLTSCDKVCHNNH